MKTKKESAALRFARYLSVGVILNVLLFYGAHVFGTWKVEKYFPRPETTGTILLHNTCAVLGKTHTLRPNTDVSHLGAGIDGTKLGGSFIIFSDGHVPGMLGLAILSGILISSIRNKKRNVSHTE